MQPIELWHSMGAVGQLVLASLFLMSVYSSGIMMDRWLLFRRAYRQSREFIRASRHLLAEHRIDDLLAEARKFPQSHLARIYSVAVSESEEEVMRHAAERERIRINQDFKRHLSGLASIASTAPFVGLFGTVIGIMNSFFGMATTGSGGIGAVAGGIAEALVNTAAGILVALPAVWGFNHFLGRMEGVHGEMGNASSEVNDYFLKRSRSETWKLEATTGQPVAR